MDDKDHIGVTGTGPDYVRISGLKSGQVQVLEAAFNSGTVWVRAEKGKLKMERAFEKLPDPIKDEAMTPFWMAPTEVEKSCANGQLKFFDFEKLQDYSSPSIMIKHLCGYNWSQKNYEEEAEKLKTFGFDIMRSPRGKDGKYWETWYLPGLWAAEGDLEITIEKAKIKCNRKLSEKKELHVALEFLRKNVVFGALDVCVQRLAMCAPD